MTIITDLKKAQVINFTDKSGFLWNITILETGGFTIRKALPTDISSEFSDQIQILPLVGNKIKIK